MHAATRLATFVISAEARLGLDPLVAAIAHSLKEVPEETLAVECPR
jgi:hypothetical protein